MCGIFGGVVAKSSELRDVSQFQRSLARMFELSESRGKEAAGIAITTDDHLAMYKAAIPASDMIKGRGYRDFLDETVANGHAKNGVAFIGHSRLVTDGGRETNVNNQPVESGGVVGIHNGIIVNVNELWANHPDLSRRLEVDSEVIFALIRGELKRGGGLIDATRATFKQLEGAASIAAMFSDRDQLLLATNNGSLYYRHAPGSGLFVFASERWIMDQFAASRSLSLAALVTAETVHVRAGQGVVVDVHDVAVTTFELAAPNSVSAEFAGDRAGEERAIDVSSAKTPARSPRTILDRAVVDDRVVPPLPRLDLDRLNKLFPYTSMRDRLRRCTKCVLPETMPFIDFDANGVCGYCRRHKYAKPHGTDELEKLVAPYRRADGRPDCVVGLSGGRDSTYGLHYIKTVLGLNPVAYTYDWGMVTPLARRNISRICGKLGIEHLWVSADIPQKREWIRKNVEAWLHRPVLGTIPLFMAGDKAYFHFLNKAKQQLGVDLGFLCENPLERTDFKTGFAGVPPVKLDDDHAYTMPMSNRAKLASYYAKEFIRNPRYVNTSLLDTVMGYVYYYVIKRDYHNLYRYVQWDEKTIERTLIDTYGFELAEDTATTWRIGDGTASFYNYIYYSIAGMTENDTFRSNQIRIGAIERERALELIDRDSRPRFPSIDWYLRTIGTDRSLEDVLSTIERAPKLWT